MVSQNLIDVTEPETLMSYRFFLATLTCRLAVKAFAKSISTILNRQPNLNVLCTVSWNR